MTGFLRRLRARRHFALTLLLAVGVVHGLLYVFLVPPWQHYDEPTHFEYAWLVANRPSWPALGDYDQAMRRQVAVSMIGHGFFYDMGFMPDLNVTNEPVWLGITQLDQEPAYYALSSLPLLFMRSADMDQQLYAARLVSLTLFLLTLVAAWLIAGLLSPPGHPLRWLAPALVALLPGFVDLMTAVNNDVAAVAAFTFFLWSCLRLALQPFRLNSLALALALAVLCYFAKSNVLVAAPILIVALGMTLLRGQRRPWLWAGLGVALVTGLALSLIWGDAAWWYRDSAQTTAESQPSAEAPLGSRVLALETRAGGAAPLVFQILPTELAVSLRGQTVSLGGWIWASEPVTCSVMRLYDFNRLNATLPAALGTRPAFYVLTATLTAEASHPRAVLLGAPPRIRAVTVYFDGVTLVRGAMKAGGPPAFADNSGAAGDWEGQPFTNLLRNGSAEDAWVTVHPRLDSILDRIFNLYVPPSLILLGPLDWGATGWYYSATLDNLLRTFWARFGWGHVPLQAEGTYTLLFAVTALGVLGGGLTAFLQRRRLSADALVILALVLAAIWGQALIRGLHSLIEKVFIPSARYTYPAIVPTVALLTAGWWQGLSPLRRALRLPAWVAPATLIAVFLALDVYSLYSLITFYAGRSG